MKVLGSDGATTLLELAAESEEEANDWIVNICQVVADQVRHSWLQSILSPYESEIDGRNEIAPIRSRYCGAPSQILYRPSPDDGFITVMRRNYAQYLLCPDNDVYGV